MSSTTAALASAAFTPPPQPSVYVQQLRDIHPLLSLFAAVFWVVLWLLSWAKFLVAFSTISVPRFIYAVLSYSLTFTLNFYSFVGIFVLSAVALYNYIRIRYLNSYATLKEPPLVKPNAGELHPDVNTTETPPAFHNYLDEFLQAVRIFGFLEKPVFHELARHLQTRRLIAGDSLSLDQDKSFYCVVDGLVQVYARTNEAEQDHSTWETEDTNGYQLLNEVRSGGTLSSLFTILSLFTEDVRMSWQDEVNEPGPDTDSTTAAASSARTRSRRSDSDVSTFELEFKAAQDRKRGRSISSSGSTVHGLGSSTSSPVGLKHATPRFGAFRHKHNHHGEQLRNHGIVALAVEDTTLAVIPAEAFKRLTKKFPKAAAHIVQVILTRFSRVTFHAAHKYLGLTTEVLRTEKAINEIACHPLPNSFYEGGGLHRLRQRLDQRTGTESPESVDYFSPRTGHSKELSDAFSTSDEATVISDSPQTYAATKETVSLHRLHPSRHMVQAGDLHSTTYISDTYRPYFRAGSSLNVNANSAEHGGSTKRPVRAATRLTSDEFDLREEVMSCIAKSIGLHQPPLSGNESTNASPAFPASEAGGASPKAGLPRSSFGSLSLLETGDDASSVTSSSAAGTSSTGQIGALDNEVEILFFAAGSRLVNAGERHAGLFYVIDGFLDISLPFDDPLDDRRDDADATHSARTPLPHRTSDAARTGKSKVPSTIRDKATLQRERARQHLFTVKPGGIAGYLASLCATPSYVDITAKMDTYVGFLPYNALERLLEKRPIVLLTLAKRLISMLSPLILHIDSSLDWVQVNAGQVLWRPGDVSDSFYIVINGRIRAIDDKEDSNFRIIGEYGQGDTVGELDVITRTKRRDTVHAIRDTELVRLPLTLFNAVSSRNPKTTSQLLRKIASRVREEVDANSSARPATELGWNNLNLKTIAILPTTRSIPVEDFAKKLHSALESIGTTATYLNQATVTRHLGRHAFTKMGKLKVAGWLADQEQRYRTVLYVVDTPVNNPWTQTCIRQADCVMVVGGGDDPSLGEYERLLMSIKTTARKELVLLHPDRSVAPGSTREWLKLRPWIHQHIHVELHGFVASVPKPVPTAQDPAAVVAFKNFKDKVQSELQKYRGGRDAPRPQRPAHMSDFARLARRICGKSIGLVLGGGGARGIAHLGLIRALNEYGIPIDHVAGTSIGSFVGGLYAREGDLLSGSGRVKQFSGRMTNIWRILSDVTYPIVAYTTGHAFNRSIYKAFYDLHIEDMWLPFFCNTTNILTSRMQIHDSGYAWRFIRASMTLVGLLPPLCDNGNLLVDGGYIDILPVHAMFSMGAKVVFACDVAAHDDNSPRNFGDSLSGFWLLINRWNPFSSTRNIPDIAEIQSRLAYVSSVRSLEEAKTASGCFYMPMPVQEYGTLQFDKFTEIQEKGYKAAMDMLQKWDEEGKLMELLEFDPEARVLQGKKKGRGLRRNSV